MAKRVLDNIERDVVAAMKLGYGVHYGRYKADYPYTKEPAPVTVHKTATEPVKPVEVEQDAVCPVCRKTFIRNHGCRKYCSEECAVKASRDKAREYYQKKRKEARVVVCPECDEEFTPVSRRQKYCCIACCRAVDRKKKAQKRKEKKHEQTLAE